MNLSTLFSLIKSDFVRLADFWGKELGFFSTLKMMLMPNMATIILYRISHFFYINSLGFLAWPLWAFNITLTGADIHPQTVIGKGFILGHSVGTILTARIGDNVTIFAHGNIGGGAGDLTKDIGAGPGLPVVEDNVIIGIHTVILGPVLIGENSSIAPCTYIRKDVPENSWVSGNPARIKPKRNGETGEDQRPAES